MISYDFKNLKALVSFISFYCINVFSNFSREMKKVTLFSCSRIWNYILSQIRLHFENAHRLKIKKLPKPGKICSQKRLLFLNALWQHSLIENLYEEHFCQKSLSIPGKGHMVSFRRSGFLPQFYYMSLQYLAIFHLIDANQSKQMSRRFHLHVGNFLIRKETNHIHGIHVVL